MNLSLKILDPNDSGVVDIGHFLFLGTETVRLFKAQIVDTDNNSAPYYIPASSSATITFPRSTTVPAEIQSNRSIVKVILGTEQMSVMISGGLSVVITTPTTELVAQLGNCVRRMNEIVVEPEDEGTVTGKVKTDATDDEAGYLGQEIVAGPGITAEVIDDPEYGHVMQISAETGATVETLNNNSGITISAGRIVRLVGDNQIASANNTSLTNARAAGITLDEIATGGSGRVAEDGIITVTLAGVSSGDLLYLGNSDGQITNIAPVLPGSVAYKIGYYNQGKIYLQFELIGVN